MTSPTVKGTEHMERFSQPLIWKQNWAILANAPINSKGKWMKVSEIKLWKMVFHEKGQERISRIPQSISQIPKQ